RIDEPPRCQQPPSTIGGRPPANTPKARPAKPASRPSASARDHPPVDRIGAASDRSRMRAAATVRGSQATGLCRGKYGSMSTATPQRPGLQAHSQATRLPTAELVSELRALLGRSEERRVGKESGARGGVG